MIVVERRVEESTAGSSTLLVLNLGREVKNGQKKEGQSRAGK